MSNRETLKVYYAREFKQELERDRITYKNLKYAPSS